MRTEISLEMEFVKKLSESKKLGQKEATFFELSSLFPEGLYLAFKKAFCVLERESEGGRQLQHKIARFSL